MKGHVDWGLLVCGEVVGWFFLRVCRMDGIEVLWCCYRC